MSDLIDRQALIKSISLYDEVPDLCSKIVNAPAIDAVEIVHAYWINSSSRKHGNLDPEFRCSNCEEIYWYFGVESFEFCPKCGAKMDGRKKDVM